jgi:dihydrofolate synthase/folylpolyglutamate synthase
MRRRRPTVVGPLPPEARRAIEAVAREKGARLVDARRGARLSDGGTLDLRTPARVYRGLRPLPGAHQRDNLLVALRLLEEASRAGLAVDFDSVPRAVARTRWPGRLQRVPGEPPLLLDGAHNPAGARALAAHLAPGPPFVLLFGAMSDKDVPAIAQALFPLARAVVLTSPKIARAATPDALAAHAGALARDAHQVPTVARALARARRLARAEGRGTIVVVAGSLYLVGAVTEILQRKAAGMRRRRRSAAARPQLAGVAPSSSPRK